ncbi:MAG TPA: peptidoglycan DD-metalloendopeptidase family protein, partial [Gemmatimonadaceae bacterium]|nr:peptidoglycan DD-metalloendopeptidase family protein [Gemmatimonadaceae bacterium]
MSHDAPEKSSGYGNIYTPSAGSMIIHVQRESGLANRTIILTQRQFRLLRRGAYVAAVLIVVGAVSWFYLAAQAARVPFLTRKVHTLQHDVRRLDTLQVALTTLEDRFQQVQKMLGAAPPPAAAPAARAATAPAATAPAAIAPAVTAPAVTAPATTSATPKSAARTTRPAPADSAPSSIPSLWPLPIAGTTLSAPGDTSGIDIAVPQGTDVRAAGAGIVVEVTEDPQLGRLVRLSHRDGYETIYANTSDVRIRKGQRVVAGAIIAKTGGAARSLPPHLHFEIRHAGMSVNPASLMKQGPA